MFDWLKRTFGFEPETRDPEPPELMMAPDGFREGVEGFAWRVLCNAYARVLCRTFGRDYLSVPQREIQAMLLPYHDEISRDAKALGVAIARAREEGVADLHRALHQAEGVDHVMLDQAVIFAHGRMRK